jgi:hypothetical protein
MKLCQVHNSLNFLVAPTCPTFLCVSNGGQVAHIDIFQTLITRVMLFFCHRLHRLHGFFSHRAAVFEIKCFFRFFRDAIRSDSAS